MIDPLDAALAGIAVWGADHAAAAIVGPDGIRAARGDLAHVFRWASITKLATAWAALSAVERGRLELDEAAGPPGSTIRHLLAHASGLAFEGDAVLAPPGQRRIYSNPGFDLVGRVVGERAARPFAEALGEWVLEPLGMTSTELVDRPSHGLRGTTADLATFARELLRPTILGPAMVRLATSVAFPGIKGVVPGVGVFDPCDWGLGPELRDAKHPHWMGERNSPGAFGHFGGAGTFLWVDPDADIALVVMTDREFGPWALEAWPRLSDEVLAGIS